MELTSPLQELPQELIEHIVANTHNIFAIGSFSQTCKQYYVSYPITIFLLNYNIFPITNREHTHALVHYAQTDNEQLFEHIIKNESNTNKKMRQKILNFFDCDKTAINCIYCSMNAYKAKGYNFINYYRKAICRNNHIGLKILTMNKVALFINESDYRGKTLLMHAVINKNKITANLLLKNNCKINVQDKTNNTALHYACLMDDSDMVKLLLNNNCFLNIQNINRDTPLHIATKNNNINITELLINKGARTNIQNKQRKIAFYYLSEKNKNYFRTKKRKFSEDTREIVVYKKQRR